MVINLVVIEISLNFNLYLISKIINLYLRLIFAFFQAHIFKFFVWIIHGFLDFYLFLLIKLNLFVIIFFSFFYIFIVKQSTQITINYFTVDWTLLAFNNVKIIKSLILKREINHKP